MVYLFAWNSPLTFPIEQVSQATEKGWKESWNERVDHSEEAVSIVLDRPYHKITNHYDIKIIMGKVFN